MRLLCGRYIPSYIPYIPRGFAHMALRKDERIGWIIVVVGISLLAGVPLLLVFVL